MGSRSQPFLPDPRRDVEREADGFLRPQGDPGAAIRRRAEVVGSVWEAFRSLFHLFQFSIISFFIYFLIIYLILSSFFPSPGTPPPSLNPLCFTQGSKGCQPAQFGVNKCRIFPRVHRGGIHPGC